MNQSKNDTSEHCWEFMNCPRDTKNDCFVYKSDTHEPCWILNQIVKKKDRYKILDTCKHCPWFLKNNPGLNQNNINFPH